MKIATVEEQGVFGESELIEKPEKEEGRGRTGVGKPSVLPYGWQGVRQSNGRENRHDGNQHRFISSDDRVGLGCAGLGSPIMLGGR
jgi:hypothetical protein